MGDFNEKDNSEEEKKSKSLNPWAKTFVQNTKKSNKSLNP